jgi:hypothetical protein
MQEATYDLTAQAFDRQPEKGDENLRVKFSNYPHFNQEKSNNEGRPIYDERCYVTIMVPGQQDIVHRVAWRRDFERFPKQYQAYLNDKDQDAVSGTPLTALTWLHANQLKELEYFNVRTVEQLAGMADNITGKFMGLQSLKQRASDFIEQAKDSAQLTKMRSELEERDERIATMEAQQAEMAQAIKELRAESGKKKAA